MCEAKIKALPQRTTADLRFALSRFQVPCPITATSRFVEPKLRLSMYFSLNATACPQNSEIPHISGTGRLTSAPSLTLFLVEQLLFRFLQLGEFLIADFRIFQTERLNVATMISETHRRVNHLWSAGMMNQGAQSVLV